MTNIPGKMQSKTVSVKAIFIAYYQELLQDSDIR